MAVKKSGKSGSKKTTVKKTAKNAGRKSSQKKTSLKVAGRNKGRVKKINFDKTPVYVLVIMIFFTMIILLINNSINKSDKNVPHIGNSVSSGRSDSDNFQNQRDKNLDNKTVRQETGKVTIVKEKQLSEQTDKAQEYYIYLVKFDRNSESMTLAPVKRNVKTKSALADTLRELIKGPTNKEKASGLLTAVPADLQIRDIQVTGRNAVLDFNNSIEENADGQILLTRIDQLVYTVTQFKGIDGVIIKVNGRRKEFLGGEGLSVSKPIGRRNSH